MPSATRPWFAAPRQCQIFIFKFTINVFYKYLFGVINVNNIFLKFNQIKGISSNLKLYIFLGWIMDAVVTGMRLVGSIVNKTAGIDVVFKQYKRGQDVQKSYLVAAT